MRSETEFFLENSVSVPRFLNISVYGSQVTLGHAATRPQVLDTETYSPFLRAA